MKTQAQAKRAAAEPEISRSLWAAQSVEGTVSAPSGGEWNVELEATDCEVSTPDGPLRTGYRTVRVTVSMQDPHREIAAIEVAVGDLGCLVETINAMVEMARGRLRLPA